MTYNVFGGTLSLTQSINHFLTSAAIKYAMLLTRQNEVSVRAGFIVNAFPSHERSCSSSWQTTSPSDIAVVCVTGRVSDPGWSFILRDGAAGEDGALFLRTGKILACILTIKTNLCYHLFYSFNYALITTQKTQHDVDNSWEMSWIMASYYGALSPHPC